MYWDLLSSKQIAQVDRKTVVILPISATEQHGAHLPLATDRLIGEHFCHELHKTLDEHVLILPSVGIGCSEHHLDFQGSLSLQHTHFMQILTDICQCVLNYGFRNILVFNSHGGNQAIGQSFVESIGFRNPQARFLLVTWWRLALKQLRKLHESGPGGVGHAGEFETSLMLHINPDLVKMDEISAMSNTSTFEWGTGDMLDAPKVSYYRTMKEMTPSGVFGDPSFATQDKGQEISDIVVKALEKIVMDIKSHE